MITEDLKKAVMNRVRFIYVIRKVLRPMGLKVGGLLLLLVSLGWFVSMFSVARNFMASSRDLSSAYSFLTRAFLDTGFAVQAITLGIAAVGVFFTVDLYKTFIFLRERSDSNTV